MAFLKRNIFNIILVVLTVIICGTVYMMLISPKVSLNAKEVKKREDFTSRIVSLRSGGVNRKMVDYEAERIKNLQESYNNLQSALDEMNRTGRESLIVSIKDKQVEFPAFPVKRDQYKKHQVQLRFPGIYRRAMDDLFSSLNATVPPEDFEIDLASDKMYNYMVQQKQDKADSSGTISDLLAGVQEGVGTGSFKDTKNIRANTAMDMNAGMMDPMMGMVPGPAPTAPGRRINRNTRRDNTAVEQEEVKVSLDDAKAAALNNLLVQKVTSPHKPIYSFKPTAFHYHYLPDNVDAAVAEMWKANVNYWVHKYVVDSIVAANKKHADTLNKPSAIENATVKRLVSIKVGPAALFGNSSQSNDIYVGEASSAGSDTGGGGGGGMGMDMGMGMGMGMGMMGPSPAGGGGGGISDGTVGVLTKRKCTTQYDVINFQFTVVLAATRLLEFEELIVANDFYTIEKVEIYDPYDTGSNIPMSSRNDAPAETSYYYGTEPVIKVVFNMESIMFAQWERNMMPVEMLERLPADALRPEDTARIDAFMSSQQGALDY